MRRACEATCACKRKALRFPDQKEIAQRFLALRLHFSPPNHATNFHSDPVVASSIFETLHIMASAAATWHDTKRLNQFKNERLVNLTPTHKTPSGPNLPTAGKLAYLCSRIRLLEFVGLTNLKFATDSRLHSPQPTCGTGGSTIAVTSTPQICSRRVKTRY
jgi:hypothetical protein